ncbi:alanine--tRNA ligase [Hyperthermus butylicus]|uniref:Alanine--tRNA ligase n=1 Tax=Hyperthermus butylicus (strain DSM 5456 / JCM 9403 / PLM1-5) TaxID=415426 RepID=SYA_HYPBU|nr:alanine--tRNA ligase [Hyperthermus butylicus]A2BN65.1 RecName: Full=Alanine--tRNA ligase; AltName: Full=Alanyl-tRNA synthetase; Short=AlaRS [Hyperthermus butylicus DSM 5456]ABM81426.1 Alanyl-tRNA synthetase [Hyperthermus butylicus DSM 5456]
MKLDPKVYQLEFFREKGFTRKQCRVCGEYFWTLNPDQEHCNDAPCVEYYFWELPRVRGLSVRDARRKFIEFFKRHGHEYVEPRPVVARWREDLYLTIASIVAFQPHVTSGIVPPPANPLVIVQPCIRLEDIDFVGLTIGRHLTSFEMGGHHAFNYPDKTVYWKEETVRFAFEFFTKELGIPEDMVTFKESWWEGGGNAGPSFEVTVGGLELATLVFMQYRVVDGKYEPMDIRVVDTGYGIERIAWFSQDVPTAFHAIYGELLDEFRKLLGVAEPPRELLWGAARAAGRLDPEDPESVERYYQVVAERAGLSIREARELLGREAALYTLLDHTKTIALMLGDGIVPSNTGEGYLARLVIRRALRTLRRLGADIELAVLVERQARYWGADYYPRLLSHLDYILRVVRLEEERYSKTLERGLREVTKLLKRKKKLSIDDLITLYDSHGVPPDMVAEAASKLGVNVDVPHNFYALVAKKHGASGAVAREVEEKPKLPRDIEEWARGFPATRRLFHENPYAREFTANLLGVRGSHVILDATLFYPTGGGQLHDTGVLRLCGEEYRVLRVEKVGDVVVHVLDREPSCSSGEAWGRIDWDRRYRLMRHHTAVHVLLGAARRVLGDHVWQAGAEKTPEKARLDITHYELPSREEIRKIEELANSAILARIHVDIEEIDRNTAEKLYGFRIYQGGVPMTPRLRIVRIGDWDVEACFGTHVANTAEIGAIKIVNVEKLQDGVVRFEIVAGSEVARYAASLEDKLDTIASIVGGGRGEAVKRVEKLAEELKEAKRQVSRLRSFLADMLVKSVKATAKSIDGVKVYVMTEELPDENIYREVMLKLSREEPDSITIAVIRRGEDLLMEIGAGSKAAKRVDLRAVAKQLASKGLRGGGKPSHITLYGRGLAEKASKVASEVVEVIASLVSRAGTA